jgi:hypothetical protein
MRPDNEVNMALSRMKSGKHPLEALSRLTNNLSSSLKHSVCTIVFFESCFYVFNLFKEEINITSKKRKKLIWICILFSYNLYFSCFSWFVKKGLSKYGHLIFFSWKMCAFNCRTYWTNYQKTH